MIRASSLGPVLRALDGHGHLANRLLSRSMLSRSMVADPYAVVSLYRYVQFLEAAAEASGDPFFCARVGTGFTAADLGPVGFLFAGSATLRRGLERLTGMLKSWQDATTLDVVAEPDRLVWTYRLEDASFGPHRQDSEYTITATIALAQESFGSLARPIEVHLEHAEPEGRPEFDRMIGLRPHYGQTANRLIFDRDKAERPVHVEDRALLAILSRHLDDLSPKAEDGDLVASVRKLIALRISNPQLNLGMIAGELGLSPRTLQRQLASHGLSVRAMLLETRIDMARSMLRDGQASNAEIARHLGYADSTALWRAFKKMTGLSPSQVTRN